MRSFIAAIVGITITLSGLCSGMGVFAMEQHLTEMQGDHATHDVMDESGHVLASIRSSVPVMACCEAPNHQTDTGIINGPFFSLDIPCAQLKTSYVAIETEPAGADALIAVTHPPDNFERRSLAKRE
jgi:hypothetical protein